MENKSELIEINFLPELENIAWKKRNPHTISYSKYDDNVKISEQDVENPCLDRKEENTIIVKTTPQNNNNTVFKIKEKVEGKRTSIKSQRGLIIEKYLVEIKSQIKGKSITKSERENLYIKLIEIKDEIELYMHTFTGADNIQGKLEQIDHYYNRLRSMNFDNNSCQEELHKTTEKTGKVSPKSSGKKLKVQENKQKSRGIEIQKRLSELKYEVRRKDLNPIEIENLKNELLSLREEMTIEIEKFSKSDCIEVRLEQIDEYLKKLETNTKEKNGKSQTENALLKESKTIKTEQNKKMKTVYHFGL